MIDWFARSYKVIRDTISPPETSKTVRLVRKLVIGDLIFLLFVGWFANQPTVIVSAVVAGNALGAIAGLLFAVPKRAITSDNQAQSGGATAGAGFTPNTSLEEVSEWLTKTIIGAGLVSWSAILRQLDRSGALVGRALVGDDGELALAGGVAVLLAASALGSLVAYLWFARHWPSELAHADFDTRDASTRGIAVATAINQEMKDVAPLEALLPSVQPASENFAGTATSAELLRQAAKSKYSEMRTAPLSHHDWAKGMFGGHSSVSNSFGSRELLASVREIDADWFKINLEVRATPKPATEAIFFLHNTFPQPTPSANFDKAGVAHITVNAFGAFTVGVLLDDGTTALELDLAQLESAPQAFRNR